MHLPRSLLVLSDIFMEGSVSEVEMLITQLTSVQICLHLDVSNLDLNSAKGFGSCQSIDLVYCVTGFELVSESGPPEPSLIVFVLVFVYIEVKLFFDGGSEAELVREVHSSFVIDRLTVQVLV